MLTRVSPGWATDAYGSHFTDPQPKSVYLDLAERLLDMQIKLGVWSTKTLEGSFAQFGELKGHWITVQPETSRAGSALFPIAISVREVASVN